MAQYSTSAEERERACCFLQAQVIGPDPILKTKPRIYRIIIFAAFQ